MKKLTLALLLALVGIGFCQPYSALQRIYDADEITWLGIDFTQAHLVDDPALTGFNDLYKIRDYYFREWNNIIFTESEKYNIRKFLRKDDVPVSLEVVNNSNDTISISKKYHLHSQTIPSTNLTEAQLTNCVASKSFNQTSGIGCILIISQLNKRSVLAHGYIAFVDFSTGQLMYAKKVTGAAGGIGFRNYWLRAYLQMYESIDIGRWLKIEKKKNR